MKVLFSLLAVSVIAAVVRTASDEGLVCLGCFLSVVVVLGGGGGKPTSQWAVRVFPVSSPARVGMMMFFGRFFRCLSLFPFPCGGFGFGPRERFKVHLSILWCVCARARVFFGRIMRAREPGDQ